MKAVNTDTQLKEMFSEFQPSYDSTGVNRIIDEATLRCIEGIHKQREQQIIERLSEVGHVFENHNELIEFAKSDRCIVYKQQIQNGSFDCTLVVDSVTVATWNDNIESNWEGDKITFTQG